MKPFLILILSLFLVACGESDEPEDPPPRLDCSRPGMCT